jgi:hypothetical protein
MINTRVVKLDSHKRLINFIDKDTAINNIIKELPEITTGSEQKVYEDILREYKQTLQKKYEIEKLVEEQLPYLPEEARDIILG